MTARSRIIDGGELGPLLDPEANRSVLTYLDAHRPSCHDDTATALLRSAEGCGEWAAYSPSFKQYRYVALVTNRRVFALGLGQRAVCYRLAPALRTRAAARGGVAAREIGPDWVRFELFHADSPAPDLAFWTLQAYRGAHEGGSPAC